MIPGGSVLGNLNKAMAAKIDTKQGREIYHHGIAIAESVFANIYTHKAIQ
jgi:hypothetical protein